MRVRRCGEHALLVEVDPAEVHPLLAALRRLAEPGIEELVPGAASVLVVGADPERLAGALPDLPLPATAEIAGRLIEVPVRYDGADLAEIAELTGLPSDDVAGRHAAATYTVSFLGFAPGFPYLAGLDPALRVPRRDSPRTRVPRGSVAVAGDWSCIYPQDSPGGWRLLGRTDLVLFDPHAQPPALLTPGDQVRFRPIPR